MAFPVLRGWGCREWLRWPIDTIIFAVLSSYKVQKIWEIRTESSVLKGNTFILQMGLPVLHWQWDHTAFYTKISPLASTLFLLSLLLIWGGKKVYPWKEANVATNAVKTRVWCFSYVVTGSEQAPDSWAGAHRWMIRKPLCEPASFCLSAERFPGHLATEPSGWMLSWVTSISPNCLLCPVQSAESWDYFCEPGVWGW